MDGCRRIRRQIRVGALPGLAVSALFSLPCGSISSLEDAVLISFFQIGSRHRLHVRHERVESPVLEEPTRLLYASDLHLTPRREHLIEQLRDARDECRPDGILLGGNLVDSTSGLAVLDRLIRALGTSAPVLVVPGNEDQWTGVTTVRDVALKAGGYWLVDNPVSIGDRLQICGTPWQRNGPSHLHVLCGHDPEVFPAADAAGFEVVIAGHLHGGHVVLWQGGERLYPGAFFARFNGLRFDSGRSTMFVSRGVADTVSMRFNCPREVLCLDLVPKLAARARRRGREAVVPAPRTRTILRRRR